MSALTIAKYLRLSLEDEDLKQAGKPESNSIANQRNLLDAHISRIPEFAEAEVLEFCDDGWSGKNFERPAVQELLLQARQGLIQCIIVKDMSRFGRDYLTVGNYISRVFPFLGVRFIAVNDGIDSIRPMDVMDVDSLDTSFKALLYDLYSRDLSRKIRSARRIRAQKGYFLSPYAPFGYVKDPQDKNHLLVDPKAAEVVRRFFQMAADGFATMQIAKTLNAESVQTRMQYKQAAGCSRTAWLCVVEENYWTDRAVLEMLRDERYIGKNIYGKRTRDQIGHDHTVKVSRPGWIIVEGAHEGIVSVELFKRAQESLQEYMERDIRPREKALLHGKVRCGICGYAMKRVRAKEPYYFCQTSLMTDAYSCSPERTPEKDIIDTLLVDLRVQAALAVDLSRIWEEKRRGKRRDAAAIQETISAHKETLERQSRKIRTLYESFALGEISKDEYLAIKSTAVKERDHAAGQISKLTSELYSSSADGNLINRFVTTFQKYDGLDELTNEAVADAYVSICVYPDGRLEIVRKY